MALKYYLTHIFLFSCLRFFHIIILNAVSNLTIFPCFNAVSQKRESRWVGPTQSGESSSHTLTHSRLAAQKTFSILSFFLKCAITEVKTPQTKTQRRDCPILVSNLSFSLSSPFCTLSINLALAFMLIYFVLNYIMINWVIWCTGISIQTAQQCVCFFVCEIYLDV